MIKKLIPLFILLLSFFSIRSQDVINIKSIKIAERKFSNNSTLFKMGTAAAPDGTKIGVTSRSLTINDSPVIPVMGEIHYARVPDNEWEKEILKMKAGGITVIATYVFWIHHEEIRDKYNWAGQRDIRKFIS